MAEDLETLIFPDVALHGFLFFKFFEMSPSTFLLQFLLFTASTFATAFTISLTNTTDVFAPLLSLNLTNSLNFQLQ